MEKSSGYVFSTILMLMLPPPKEGEKKEPGQSSMIVTYKERMLQYGGHALLAGPDGQELDCRVFLHLGLTDYR